MLGKSSIVPIRRWRGRAEQGDVVRATSCSQDSSLASGAALAGFPLPEGGEEAGADAVVGAGRARTGIYTPGKTTEQGMSSQHHGAGMEAACNIRILSMMSAGTPPGGRIASQAVRSCCPSLSPPQ